MSQLFTTEKLLSSIKSRGMVPTSQSTFSNEAMLELATEVLHGELVPSLLKIREEFYVDHTDYQLQANQGLYAIPDRAVGSILRDMLYTQSNNITDRTEFRSMNRIEPDRAPETQNYYNGNWAPGFTLRANDVEVKPVPSQTTGNIRMVYMRRPNCLVEVNKCARVTAVNAANEVVVSSIPSSFSTGEVFDCTPSKPHFRPYAIDQSVSAIDTVGLTITFSSDVVDENGNNALQVGDYISIATETCIPELPLEMQPLLSQKTVVKVLEALGDQAGFQRALAKAQQLEEQIMYILTPRVQGEPRKIMSQTFRRQGHRGY